MLLSGLSTSFKQCCGSGSIRIMIFLMQIFFLVEETLSWHTNIGAVIITLSGLLTSRPRFHP